MSYRVELSPSARAGCTNGECSKEKIKIPKGDLRAGVLITIQDRQSFKWRHWGCVTPQMLGNMKVKTENNLDYLDGYEELPSESQEKIARAFEQGHVDDEDWKGDLSQNRPGAKGFRSPAPKKKKDVESIADEEEGKPAVTKRKRGRAGNDEHELHSPISKKAKVARDKRKKAGDNHEVEAADEVSQSAAKKGAKARRKGKTDKDEHGGSENAEEPKQPPAPPAKKPRASKKKSAKVDEGNGVSRKPNTSKEVKANGTGDSAAAGKSNASRKSSRSKK